MFDNSSICKKWSIVAFLLLISMLLAQSCQAQSVSIVISSRPSDPERIAGDEFQAQEVVVLSGTGAREYYRTEFGYSSRGDYMVKEMKPPVV